MADKNIVSFQRAFYNPHGRLYCWPIDEIKTVNSKKPYKRTLPSGKICKGEISDYYLLVKWKQEANTEEYTIYDKDEYTYISGKIERLNRLFLHLDKIAPNQYQTFFYNNNFIVIIGEEYLDFSKLQKLADSGVFAIPFNDAILCGEMVERHFLIFDSMFIDSETIRSIKSILRNYNDDIRAGYKSHLSHFSENISNIIREIDSQY